MTYNKQKKKPEDLTVQSAKYVQDFMIAITFTNGRTTVFDFLPLFHKYVKGENIKYFAPHNFKKFHVKNGNIYWGRDEDVIFPATLLLNSESDLAEELYTLSETEDWQKNIFTTTNRLTPRLVN